MNVTMMPEVIKRPHASLALGNLAAAYERKYGDRFDFLVRFSEALLKRLHGAGEAECEIPHCVTVASRTDATLLPYLETLKSVANKPRQSADDQQRYMGALLAIYQRLPSHPSTLVNQPDVLCVGIEREGRILAEAMKCLPEDRSIRPHAKRIPYDHGLVIGLMGCAPRPRNYSRCVIIDGAIASGATVIAVIGQLQGIVRKFHIFSVHGPCEGLRAIASFAEEQGLELSLTVGHVTGHLNQKFYAIDKVGGLVIGDVGDTISALASHCA